MESLVRPHDTIMWFLPFYFLFIIYVIFSPSKSFSGYSWPPVHQKAALANHHGLPESRFQGILLLSALFYLLAARYLNGRRIRYRSRELVYRLTAVLPCHSSSPLLRPSAFASQGRTWESPSIFSISSLHHLILSAALYYLTVAQRKGGGPGWPVGRTEMVIYREVGIQFVGQISGN